ncbi:alpha/beta fold hydrolase [Streptomyces uncialis]|uniref:alpha/beta fold hydrolase n=1 Tax=Streptomyces uncialis TaxID=1048205 RepID=UPI00381F72FC
MPRSSRTVRTAALGATVAAVCLSVLPAAPAGAAGPAADPGRAGPPDRFHHQQLDWRSCVQGPGDEVGKDLERAGARCAGVTVPLDHRNPDGRTITIAVSRIEATDRARRIGPLLLNGGGPGGPSLGDAPAARDAMKDVAGRYDIIGVDPRFVGRSAPVDCDWPTGTAFRSPGKDRAGFDRTTAFLRELAQRCRTAVGDVLPFASTRDTARDMDIIRAALGERKISYLGYSYGSYLGQVYVSMFPGRADRVVLDGVIDPVTYGPRLLAGATAENRAALENWATWVADRHRAYGLGASRKAVVRTVEGVRRSAERAPFRLGEFTLDEHTVPALVFGSLSEDNPEAFDRFARMVREMRQAASGAQVSPSPDVVETLKFVFTGAASAGGSAQNAILCADKAAPRDPEVYWRDVERARAKDALLGPFTHNANPCAFWDRPAERPTKVTGDFPALLVNSVGDPRTTYRGARVVRADWSSSRLITLRGSDQHAVYGFFGNRCVDDRVNAYLATGELPAKDSTCRPEPGQGTR